MKDDLQSVEVVAEGIMVKFSSGLRCFFSTGFLQSQVGVGSNHIFLDYDPSPTDRATATALLGALDTSNMIIQ